MKQSDFIKQLRGNLTQQEFAAIVGEQRAHISRYENNRSAMSLPKFLEWCEKTNNKLTIKSAKMKQQFEPKETRELSPSEFKKLVCDIAVAIAPRVYDRLANDPNFAKVFDEKFDEHMAYLSHDAAYAIGEVLKDRHGAKF